MRCLVLGCTLSGNTAPFGGGGSESTLNHCAINGNATGFSGGGVWGSTLNNCTLWRNIAGRGGGAFTSTLNNCTLVHNSVQIQGGGASSSVLTNCILYNNQASGGGPNSSQSTLSYCCTVPVIEGLGNFTNAPLLLNSLEGDVHLSTNSPCINAGRNAVAWVGSDIDGHPRISGGTVDVGAYEFQNPGSSLSYAWLQGYGLPTDGTADPMDNDGDGANNYQEWRAGTNPTNAASLLRLLPPAPSPSGISVSWQSVRGFRYFVDRSTNLEASPIFLPWATNIIGRPETTVLIDEVGDFGRVLFRVGMQE
jgi:hypothetical protein